MTLKPNYLDVDHSNLENVPIKVIDINDNYLSVELQAYSKF